MRNRNVTCIYCGKKTKIPDSKPSHRNAITLVYLAVKNWQFYGRGKGQCPECNLFTQPAPKDMAACLEGGL